MKALLAILLVAAVSANEYLYGNARKEVDPYDFFRGFLGGIGDTEDLKELKVCLDQTEPAMNEIRKGLKLIITLDISKMFQGFMYVVGGIKLIQETMAPCIKKYPALTRLEAAIRNTDVSTIIRKIVTNALKYKNLIENAIKCFKTQDLKCAGSNFGLLAKSLYLEKMDERVGNNSVVEFLKGFLEGIGETADINELIKCLKALDESIEKIKEALYLITNGNFTEMLKGIKMFLEAVRDFLAKMHPCASGTVVLKKLINAILTVDFAVVIKKILLNLNRIIAECGEIIKDFDEEDYKGAGFGIGNLLKFLFL